MKSRPALPNKINRVMTMNVNELQFHPIANAFPLVEATDICLPIIGAAIAFNVNTNLTLCSPGARAMDDHHSRKGN